MHKVDFYQATNCIIILDVSKTGHCDSVHKKVIAVCIYGKLGIAQKSLSINIMLYVQLLDRNAY